MVSKSVVSNSGGINNEMIAMFTCLLSSTQSQSSVCNNLKHFEARKLICLF